MSALDEQVTFFAETNFRGQRRRFGIKTDDRRRHMYVIGKTGMGKTTMLENMVIQDIINGHGMAYIDPHGDTAERLLDFIPPNRINDVIYFNPGDLQYPIAFNILESVETEHKHLVASGLMAVFTKIWANLWSARMEYILNNTILALLEVPGNTLLGIMRMLVDKDFRKKIVSRLKDPMVKSFWTDEYANWNDRFRTEAIQPIQNKVGQFLSSSIIRNIVGQPKSTLDLREIMDKRKILIMNLSKGRIGEDASALLGAMMITKLQLAAMSRVDIPNEADREDFFLYVDEFQNYATESFANILSEARKYRLNLIMAHQYIGQLTDEVKDAVFGNVGTIVNFRVGAEDAAELEKEFTPYLTATDIVNLPKFKIFLKLMIDGVASRPFSAQTFPAMAEGNHYPDNKEKVIKVSRERYAKPADEVEEKIIRWLDPTSVSRDAAEGATVSEEEEAYEHSDNKSEKNTKKDKEPNALCDNCGKGTHITFTPDEKRNVFCKDCLTLFKEGKVDPSILPKRNIPSTNQVQQTTNQQAQQNTPAQPAERNDETVEPDTSQKVPQEVSPQLVEQNDQGATISEPDKPSTPEPVQTSVPAKPHVAEASAQQNSSEISLQEMLTQPPKSFKGKRKNDQQQLQPGVVVKLNKRD